MILSILIVGWNPTLITDFQETNANNPIHSKSSELSSSSPIIIESDDDFKILNLSGNGTLTNPYVFGNTTVDGACCIDISNTRSHFRIENCTLRASELAIKLLNVSNAVIVGNTIYSYSNTLDYYARGIEIESSSLGQIANNSIKSDGTGISITSSFEYHIDNNSIVCRGFAAIFIAVFATDCNDSVIVRNSILSARDGLRLARCNDLEILNNTIACNVFIITIDQSSNNYIVGNSFATNVENCVMAVDDGTDNSWDDEVSQGNAWMDYQGTGVYNISGSANSIDHFPTKFEPTFPMDFNGPIIEAYVGFVCIDYIGGLPDHYTLFATVTDPSGVDTVIVTINGILHEMTHQPTAENPDYYVYDYPNPSSFHYSYWANDSLGFCSITQEGYISLGYFPSTTTSSSTPTTSINSTTSNTSLIPADIQILVTSSIFGAAVLAIIVLFWKKKE